MFISGIKWRGGVVMDFDFDDVMPICCNCIYEKGVVECSNEQRAEDIRNGCEKKQDGIYCCYFKGYFEN